MSLWSRIANVFRAGRLSREVDEELESHLAEAVEQGRDLQEARRAFGSLLRHREASRDVRLAGWLDSVRADAVFGWRQMTKTKVTTAAAVLSLGLSLGACLAAFRLIDALLLRPLPVTGADRLYLSNRYGTRMDGQPNVDDSNSYPMFRLMREAVEGQAELIGVSYSGRADLTYKSDEEMEKAQQQFVSGWMFESFGLKPAAGRLLTAADDRTPGAHSVAVLSHDYWTRRFNRDPNAVGRTFRMGNVIYEIVGVVEEGFTGTEPGVMMDVYLPIMMHPAVTRSDSSWFRTLVRLAPGANVATVQQKMHAVAHAFERERSKGWIGASEALLRIVLEQELRLDPAPTGVSYMQKNYRVALAALGVLVALVLLIACANVANLMTARAAGRAREMALRVSIGAGRRRLVQLMLLECGWLALLSSLVGGLFALWAAPLVVALINPSYNPARLQLPVDWRVMGFAAALALFVTVLFGLTPALRASRVRPAGVLKGGDDPHARKRLAHILVAAQVAFCFVVLLVAGLFVSTYEQLARQPTGFSSERLLVLQSVSAKPQPAAYWEQVAAHLRSVPGVEQVGLADHALMDGYSWNGGVSLRGETPGPTLTFYRATAPGWLDTMRIPLVAGRDFLPGDLYPRAAVVNETFARTYFGGQNPVGKSFARNPQEAPIRIVGLMRDARYRGMREAIPPVAFFPFTGVNDKGEQEGRAAAAFLVRVAGSQPLTMAQLLRREVPKARPEFRVSNVRMQQELVDQHTIRERLLAMLALFFAGVAVVLAGVGLFGMLDYAVVQRRREIGIRLAIGAPASSVVRSVTAPALAMVVVGIGVGLLLGGVVERYLQVLLYGVKATDPAALLKPMLALFVAALLASLRPALRAVRTDPVQTLRSE